MTHTWTPVDLVAAGDEPETPPTIGGLLYPGLRHLILGEPESLKSWLALVLAVDEIRAGRTVVLIDLESAAREMLARLRALGLTDQEISGRFAYLHPTQPICDDTAAADLARLIDKRRPSLVIVDAAIGALSLHGLDPNRADDIERFHRVLIDPLAAYGAAIALIDHVAKSREDRGRWATGSERKLGRVDVALGIDIIQPFGRGRTGTARITVAKDRPGYLNRPRAGELELASDPDTGRITSTIRPASNEPDPAADTWRPTVLMERVAAHLAEQSGPVTRNAIETAVRGKRDYIRKAIDALIADGNIVETRNGASRLCTLVRPFASPPLVEGGERGEGGEPSPGANRGEPGANGTNTLEEEAERLLHDHADLLNGSRL